MRTGGMRARERYHHDRYRTCGHTGRAEYRDRDYMPVQRCFMWKKCPAVPVLVLLFVPTPGLRL